MGLNAVVAFELVAGRGLTWPQAMTIVFLEGAVITVLVLTRFRQAMLDAVPLALKRAISVGIGLFIAFIGFFTAGFVVKPDKGPLPVALGPLAGLPIVVFVIGFVLTAWLMARRVRGALLLGIVLTTVLAIVLNLTLAGGKGFATPGAAQLPAAIVQAPDFSTFGRLDVGVIARLGVVATVLVTFSIMLSDFFDTMGTIIGVGGKGGFLDVSGRLPRAGPPPPSPSTSSCRCWSGRWREVRWPGGDAGAAPGPSSTVTRGGGAGATHRMWRRRPGRRPTAGAIVSGRSRSLRYSRPPPAWHTG